MKPYALTLIRGNLGLTRAELAQLLRVKYATVYQWELPEDHKQNRAIPGMVEAFLERLIKEKRK